jgi:hypothetical protein
MVDLHSGIAAYGVAFMRQYANANGGLDCCMPHGTHLYFSALQSRGLPARAGTRMLQSSCKANLKTLYGLHSARGAPGWGRVTLIARQSMV